MVTQDLAIFYSYFVLYLDMCIYEIHIHLMMDILSLKLYVVFLPVVLKKKAVLKWLTEWFKYNLSNTSTGDWRVSVFSSIEDTEKLLVKECILGLTGVLSCRRGSSTSIRKQVYRSVGCWTSRLLLRLHVSLDERSEHPVLLLQKSLGFVVLQNVPSLHHNDQVGC